MRIKHARKFPTALAFGQNSPNEQFVAVIVKATFRLENRQEPARLAEVQRAILAGDELYDPKNPESSLKFESEQVPFKPRSDIVLVGSAHAPHGRPVRSLDVLIRVGETRRALRVFGDRLWSFPDPRDPPVVVGPAEFASMPLRYERSFGGSDERAGLDPELPAFRPWCDGNLIGRGFCGKRSVESIHQKPLPNVEDPENLVRGWDSRPVPVGCGFFPRNSKPRSLFAGTYDDKWKATRAPEPPEDFRFDVYNGADRSLQVKNYLLGNESVTLTNVTPGGGTLECWLPCLKPHLVATGQGKTFVVPAQLDTLVFVPDEGIFYQVWRGLVGIERPEKLGVDEVRIEYETLAPGPGASAFAPGRGYA